VNRQRIALIILSALVFVCTVIWSALLDARPEGLVVTFFDVGQGDATFIETPSGRRILIDGGPDRSVLRELSKAMPWWDRSIDVVIATHPDADHISGLIDVLQRYDVAYILEPGVVHDTPQAESLLSLVANEGAERFLARRGQYIDFGDGVRLEVLFPDREVTRLETNTASIVSRLSYGDTSFLFTGDAPESIESYLVALHGPDLDTDVLKTAHHGSRTSTSLSFVGFASPDYAVISRGCDNSYGHPHQEVLDTFAWLDVMVVDTCTEGNVTFSSDGLSLVRN
jgi:competence protein ComEC